MCGSWFPFPDGNSTQKVFMCIFQLFCIYVCSWRVYSCADIDTSVQHHTWSSFPRTEAHRCQLKLMPAFLIKSSLKNREGSSSSEVLLGTAKCIWDVLAWMNAYSQEKALNPDQTCFCNLCLPHHRHTGAAVASHSLPHSGTLGWILSSEQPLVKNAVHMYITVTGLR